MSCYHVVLSSADPCLACNAVLPLCQHLTAAKIDGFRLAGNARDEDEFVVSVLVEKKKDLEAAVRLFVIEGVKAAIHRGEPVNDLEAIDAAYAVECAEAREAQRRVADKAAREAADAAGVPYATPRAAR